VVAAAWSGTINASAIANPIIFLILNLLYLVS
jgi:hypothetical protein